MLESAHRPLGEREGPWYDEHIKVHEYAGMTATAREIPRARMSCPAIWPVHRADSTTPGTGLESWVAELGGI